MEVVLRTRKTQGQAGRKETIIPFLPAKQNPSSKASLSPDLAIALTGAPAPAPQMEQPGCRVAQLFISSAVLLLGMVAFSCCVAAEFTKSKATRDLKLDGSLCSLQRSSAFALGITALVCLSVAQIAGTSAAGARICSGNSRRRRSASIVLLVLSWLSFALAAILLGTASSMSNKQAYGRGWLDGECYLVKDGVYIGSAILAVSTVIFILGFTLTATSWATLFPTRRTLPDEAGKSHLIQFQPKESAAAPSLATQT